MEQIAQTWGKFLQQTGDISSLQNIEYFRKMIDEVLLHKKQENMFVHELGGFYRWRILETVGYPQFKVNFHVFEPSKTQIHSHGYEGFSYVLEGNIEYVNFTPQTLSNEESAVIKMMHPKDFQKNVLDHLMKQYLEKISLGNFEHIDRKMLTRIYETYNITNIGAFLFFKDLVVKNPILGEVISDDLQKLLLGEISVGQIHDITMFFSFSVMGNFPQTICQFFSSRGEIFKMFEITKIQATSGDGVKIGEQQAHMVQILNHTATLFITHEQEKPQLPGGDFQYLPCLSENIFQPNREQASKEIFKELTKIQKNFQAEIPAFQQKN